MSGGGMRSCCLTSRREAHAVGCEHWRGRVRVVDAKPGMHLDVVRTILDHPAWAVDKVASVTPTEDGVRIAWTSGLGDTMHGPDDTLRWLGGVRP